LKFLYFLNKYQNSAQAKIANVVAKSGAFGVSSIGKTAKIKPPPTYKTEPIKDAARQTSKKTTR